MRRGFLRYHLVGCLLRQGSRNDAMDIRMAAEVAIAVEEAERAVEDGSDQAPAAFEAGNQAADFAQVGVRSTGTDFGSSFGRGRLTAHEFGV